jgi:sugar/nucleoside kinase (ribokinase family)
MYDISFIGSVSRDINVVNQNERIVPGGGSFYAAFAAKSILDKVQIIAKCPKNEINLFGKVKKCGIDATWIESQTITSIKNTYPSENPDIRISELISRCDSYTESDLSFIDSKIVHITPLIYGELDEDIIYKLRERVDLLSLDVQGFLRKVSQNKELKYYDWEKKDEFLSILDILKVDQNEAAILTNSNEPLKSVQKLASYGIKEIVLTRKEGVIVYISKEEKTYEWPFENPSLEGRTGRGDTCIGAYLAARINNPPNKAGAIAAKITNEKMKNPGPWMENCKNVN